MRFNPFEFIASIRDARDRREASLRTIPDGSEPDKAQAQALTREILLLNVIMAAADSATEED